MNRHIGERDSESREVPYMFFDFRHGPNQWPEVRHSSSFCSVAFWGSSACASSHEFAGDMALADTLT